VHVTLVKVVPLPDDDLGLRFAFDSSSTTCCSLFPRLSLASDGLPSTSVVVRRSDVTIDGILDMRLSENGGSTVPFRIDLARLGVPFP